ncbi:MAG: cyclic nucleotide-binding domain-containing protein, partial [Burkholderia sp.]|nr:cyclic nucleotide-binding domain-containing protein [Burkholderia sp.]
MASGRREDEEAARRRRSAELLAGADLFAGLDRVTLAKLAANLDRVSLRKGEAACIEGEPGDSLYIVSEGTFGVFVGGAGEDRRLRVATLRPGGCFGEMALLTGEPRSASVIADREGELLRLDQERFTDLLRRDPSIGLALSASLSRRLHGAMRSIREGDELVRRQTEARLARMPPEARERVLEASIMPEATPAALECLFGRDGPDLSSRLAELGWRDGSAPEPIARALREAHATQAGADAVRDFALNAVERLAEAGHWREALG